MQRVSLLKEVNVRYATGTLGLITTGTTGKSIAFAERVNGWIPTCEELPPVETEVLILHNGKRRIGALEWDIAGVEDSYKSYNYWDDPNNDGQDWEWNDVTHWQYLPPVIDVTVSASND